MNGTTEALARRLDGERPTQAAVRRHRHSEAVEDYAKAIHSLQERLGGPVPTTVLAERLAVTPGSVSAMVKRLAQQGLVVHVPYHGVELTPAGERVALEVIRHHDPHGDPLPCPSLAVEDVHTLSLSALAPGTSATFARVSDSDAAMLRFLADRGIAIGARLEVVDRVPFDGPVLVRVGAKIHPLGGRLADAMRVEPDAP